MTPLFLTALTLGMIGSFHCIGMCGPLAFSLPLSDTSDRAKFIGALWYNVGRITTYSLLGLLFGMAGKGFSLLGYQRWLSLCLGIVILFFLIIPKKWSYLLPTASPLNAYASAIRTQLGKLFFKKSTTALLAIGLLNGLLPCGLIYMAIAGAIATAAPYQSALFMAVFGLGTLPIMWSVSFFGNYVSSRFRKKIRYASPIVMGLMAVLLIARGMGLGNSMERHSAQQHGKIFINCLPIATTKQP